MGDGEETTAVHVDLPQDLTAAGAARSASRSALRRWRLPGLVDPVLLAVSELVGNAVRHGRPPVDLRLRRRGSGVRVDVHDDAPEDPATRAHSDEAESGRGLLLVEAVSTETGVEHIEGDGKVVWAQIEAPMEERT